MHSLLLFTIGPVQSFIARARKTQDLYAGSYLLSHLSRTAARKIQTTGGRLIFPDPHQSFLPNRMLAMYRSIPGNSQQKIGESIKNAVQREFMRIGDTILEELNLTKPPSFDTQLERHLEIHWLFHPFSDGNYLADYNNLLMYLGAVKNTRHFAQLRETGAKCTIGGRHKVMFYRSKNKNRFRKSGVELPARIPERYMKYGEGLGAVNFVKRCADQYFSAVPESGFKNEFPSTARVAFMDTWHWLEQEQPGRKWPQQEIDEQLIFELKQGLKKAEDVDTATNGVYQLVCDRRICPYYAVMRFDGDNMGKWYSDPGIKHGAPLDFHKELSQNLQRFAKEVTTDVMVWPKGEVVYAGGEDFLGLINLKHLLDIMTDLRKRFKQINLLPFTDKKLSFSAGIAIAHFKSPPLAETLKWAHRMEQDAKNIDSDKDAFGLAVLKRTGEIHHTVYKWDAGGRWTPRVLGKLVDRLQNGHFSPVFIRYLNRSIAKLASGDVPHFEGDEQIIKAEIRRLVARACLLVRRKGETERDFGTRRASTVQEVVDNIETLYNHSLGKGLNNFISALNIVAFLRKVMPS